MKFSIVLPNCMTVEAVSQPWEADLSGAEIARVARLADEIGFSTALVSEHFFFPTEHVALSGEHALHATTALGYFAGVTNRLRIGSLVSILTLQHPVVAAKAWATLDWLSGGRAIVGLGVGWLREEFDVLGVPFRRRGRLMDEYVDAMVELWTAERPAFHGHHVDFADIAFAPKPVQTPYPPIWFGGDSRAAAQRVARIGSGWAPLQTPPERIPDRLEYIRSQPTWRDRPLDVFYSTAWLNMGDAHAVLDNPAAKGSWHADEVVDQCGRLAELGVTETWVPPPPVRDLEEYLDHMRWLAAEIMPKLG